ncbi:hypothetical protein AOPFMNJM_1515 [Methylobacterium jeotgali]|uniref:Secreted protein n=1 Tax=Methylobacterium jeotgali TaxID=381630 RepID=A0ABQ4SWZ6_9HYPH|nr:hypothetical protein AOPFMNJM_1515 [Methylobacterium jeotgali]
MPCWMLVILNQATSLPSTALRAMTRPAVVWASSPVLAAVTLGVSATGATVIETVPVGLLPCGPFWPSLIATAIDVEP